MTTAEAHLPLEQLDERAYKRRIWAWTMYDWGNSAFATTILAAVLPAYYSSVAGATLPSEATATAYWSIGLSVSLFLVAIISPILGTISDIKRNKKPLLSIFAGVGIVATGLLVLVSTGDWLLASVLFVLSRIGFTGANVFYDALLPHVAKESDRDEVSTRGYAMGYLGGGLLLAINIAMIQLIPDSLFEFAGIRLSFLSVAIWWGIFTIPLLRAVPEPPAATAQESGASNVLAQSFGRLWNTFRDVQQYRELFKYLVAFLIYNDGIGTIIGVAVIYGAELGFGTIELLLALLLVQFVGIPFSLVFGRLPSPKEKRRGQFLAFILFNLVALPLGGLLLRGAVPVNVSGAPPAPYATTAAGVGEGVYTAGDPALNSEGTWDEGLIPAADIDAEADQPYAFTTAEGARYTLQFNGALVVLTYSVGPEGGLADVLVDGAPLLDDDGAPVVLDSYNPTQRYNVTRTLAAPAPGAHELAIVNRGEAAPESGGTWLAITGVEVLPPVRVSSPFLILGVLLGIQVTGLIFAALLGRPLFSGLAERLDTKSSVLLALLIYSVIAIWGFVLNSTLEYWFLAWMVAVVQGGSQALSRSLYAAMSPAAKSGEFFGLYGIMEKFSAILGPLLFAAAATIFGSSRPAILSLIVLFIIGGALLSRVDVEEGRRAARAEDAAVLGGA
ncbi:MAG: MFS transporter [Anaerolineae bacterium]|nr:MFS transporter [Anaerolineae bacterium]